MGAVATTETLAALRAHAQGPLRAWLDAREPAVRSAIARVPGRQKAVAAHVLPESSAAGGADMSYAQAVAWAKSAAQALIENTHYDEAGRMAQDAVGASVSTASGLKHFAGAPSHPDLDMMGIELLQTHVGQLDRDTYKAARRAIFAEGARQGRAAPPADFRFFPVERTAKSGLNDGSAYVWEKSKGKVSIRFPLQRGGPRVNELLAAANIPRSAYHWAKQPNETYASWLVVQPDWVERIATAVAAHYPVLAAALRQNAPVWLHESAAARAAAPPQALDPKRGAVSASNYDSIRWAQGDNGVIRIQAGLLGKHLRQSTAKYKWLRDAQGAVDPRFILLITPSELARGFAQIGAQLPQTMAATIKELLPAWIAAAPAEAAPPEDTAPGYTRDAANVPPDGAWTTAHDLVYLTLAYKAEAVGWHRALRSAVVFDKVRKAFVFSTRHALAVADAVKAYYPKIATALRTVFADVPQTAIASDYEMGTPQGVRAENLDALLHLRDVADLEKVQDRTARQAVAAVERAVSLRASPKMRHKPYQTIGTAFAQLTGYRALIADEPGVGKTAQAIGCLLTAPEQLLPCVIVAPGAVVYNWQKELNMWAPTIPTYIVKNGAVQIPHSTKGVVILSWDMLATNTTATRKTGRVDKAGNEVVEKVITGWPVLDQLKGWAKCAIFDESHYMKNIGVQRTDAALMLARLTPHVLLLSGTPIENKPWEAWTQLHAVDPQAWSDYKAFIARYAETDRWGAFLAPRNETELRDKIAPYTIRRRKAQVLKDLPPLTRVYVNVDMPKTAWTEYARVSAEFDSWLSKEYRQRLERAQAREGLDPNDKEAQAEVSARIEAAMAAEALTQSSQLRAVLARGKIPAIITKVGDLLEQGQPVVVFLDHIDGALDELSAALTKKKIRHGTIQGGMTDKAKHNAVQDFQGGKYDVLLLSQAGREGITLTRASNMIMAEYFWTPGRMEQAEGRLHRQGQTNPVTIWYMHVNGTYDDKMRNLLESKAVMVSAIMGSDEVASETIASADFVGALLQRQEQAPRRNGARVLVHAGTRTATRAVLTLPAVKTIRALVFSATRFPNRAVVKHWARATGFDPAALELHPDGYVLPCTEARRFVQGSLRVAAVAPGVKAIVGQPQSRMRPRRRVGTT